MTERKLLNLRFIPYGSYFEKLKWKRSVPTEGLIFTLCSFGLYLHDCVNMKFRNGDLNYQCRTTLMTWKYRFTGLKRITCKSW